MAKEVCANFIGEILQSDIKASDEFGYSLKVDKENGKLAVLGAPGTDGGKGKIYLMLLSLLHQCIMLLTFNSYPLHFVITQELSISTLTSVTYGY